LFNQRKFDEAGQLLRLVAKKYDSAASKKVIHPNLASRYKSRFMRKLNTQRSAS
jgi:ribosomal protein S20